MWLSFEHKPNWCFWGAVLSLSLVPIMPERAIAQIPDLRDESTQGSELVTEPVVPVEQRLPQLRPLPSEQPLLEDEPFDRNSLPVENSTSQYILGVGDEINVAVIDFPEFTLTQFVLPDGTITVPLIGSVRASERTLETLKGEITRRLSTYVVDPVVELSLTALRPTVVTVGGEVYRPGPIQLSTLPSNTTAVPSVSTALVNAGGVRRSADLRSITVQRRLPNGNQETLTVNLWESIFQGEQGGDILLQDQDVVFVPKALAESDIDPRLVSRSSLAPAEINVRIIGEVNRPGETEVSPDSTVLSTLAAAAGPNNDANLRDVALLRLDDSGQLIGQQLDLRSFEDTTPVQDGDIIVVPKKGYLNFLDGVSRTLRPITTPFSFLLLLNNVGGIFGND